MYTNPAGATVSSWSSLNGESFSTFTFAAVNPGSSLPLMKFAGWQAGTAQFTTLSFGQPGNGAASSGAWQTWTLGTDSLVFQSNASDAGFCVQASPCTFGAFLARYPTGLWGQMQIGLGSGAAAGAQGFADAVSATHGVTSYAYDFEVPASSNSTAAIRPGSQTSTGGQVTVTLNASSVAAGSVVFTITSTLPDGTIQTTERTVAAGDMATATLDVPFGSTSVSVTAQDVSIATGTVTFTAPTPAGTTAPGRTTTPSSTEQLAESGSTTAPLWIPAGVLLAGVALVLATRRITPRRRNTTSK
ncbi:hypothetical protein [Humibacter sp. RRB41]|uniref:hypothetical protein n=1 Tax=Humibacter sp. RRB41 TaxID=2919946 RepID=UPI001FA9828E|nr:hypothetical protein [Humibacter sp. RRB41]